jgi:plastocyanin
MLRGHLLSVWFVLALVLTTGTPLAASAQDATPAASPAAGAPPVVASGLTNPRGMTWGADGTLYVALAGNGGTNPGVGEPLPPPAGPEVGGGPSAAVAAIGPDGCPVAVATGLPSSLDVIGTVVGVADVAILGDQLYALVSGGGGSHGNPDQPSGLYRVYADGSFELAADLQSWYKANPVARPAEVEPDGQWYGMVAASDGTALWVVESNGGQVLTVTPDGTITRVADLSQGHPVPTGIALAPDGGVYVGYLTALPFVDGTSRVDRVAPDGSVSTVWSGLSMVTGIAVAPDGTLYATEMATGEPASMEEPPFQPFTGRVVRQSGADGLEEVATGMLFPVNLRFGPDGGLNVALPAAGADNGEGVILRLDPATAGAIQMPAGPPPASDCAPITPPPPPPVTPAPTGSPAAELATPDATSAMEETVAVSLMEFAIDMPSELPAGPTTFEITNDGTIEHNFEVEGQGIEEELPENLAPGATGTLTVDLAPGTYEVYCPVGNHEDEGMRLELTVTEG